MSALTVKGLGLHLGRARILQQITLTIEPGSKHVVTGHNGAGKSSLLSVLAGTIRPTNGKVYLGHRDVTGWAPHRLARAGVARLWQHPQIWEPLSVADNLRLALGTQARPLHLECALQKAGLTEVAGRRAGDLSYGQRRSVELAIALAQQPALLILDEPSAGLSAQARQALADMLVSADPHLTLLIADHDHGLLARIATHRTELASGRIVHTGPAWWEPLPANATPRLQPSSGSTASVALTVAGLTVNRDGRMVLQGFNVVARESEIVAITGPNGSGKSTLIASVAGLISPQAGMVTVRGRPMSGLDTAARVRAGLHAVMQDGLVFGRLTVAENLRVTGCGMEEAALFPQLAGKSRQLAGSLSGGEKQMLAIAMALANKPHVVMLDEPFEGLANEASEHLTRVLAEQASTGTAFIVSGHRYAGLLESTASRVIDLPPVLAEGSENRTW